MKVTVWEDKRAKSTRTSKRWAVTVFTGARSETERFAKEAVARAYAEKVAA